MFFTLTFSPLKINLTHIFGDEFYEFAYNSCTILRLMLTFSPYLFSRFRRYLLRSVPSSICLLDTKSSKKSNVTTDVCQFSRRKVGGYDCQAKYCIKRFKNVESGSTNGLILVEKAASVHNHAIKDTSEERVYHLSTKLVDSIIMECIKDCMSSRTTKAKGTLVRQVVRELKFSGENEIIHGKKYKSLTTWYRSFRGSFWPLQ